MKMFVILLMACFAVVMGDAAAQERSATGVTDGVSNRLGNRVEVLKAITENVGNNVNQGLVASSPVTCGLVAAAGWRPTTALYRMSTFLPVAVRGGYYSAGSMTAVSGDRYHDNYNGYTYTTGYLCVRR